MAVIDTLKLARALRDKGGFAEEAAEATAEAINVALGERMASKADLDHAVGLLRADLDHAVGLLRADLDHAVGLLRADLDHAVGQLTTRLNFMQWQIGIIAALQIATLVKLFMR
jgi:hypothetical protein